VSKGDRRRDEQDAEEPFGEEEGDALPENQAPEEPAQEGEEAPPEGATYLVRKSGRVQKLEEGARRRWLFGL